MQVRLGDTIYPAFFTHDATGASADADSTPTVNWREDGGAASTAGVTVTNVTTGEYEAEIVCSSANGFETGKWYEVAAIAVVGGVTSKQNIRSFQVVEHSGIDGVPAVSVAYWLTSAVASSSPAGFPQVNVAYWEGNNNATGAVQSGLATAAALATVDNVVDAIQAKTDNLPPDPADASVIAGLIDALPTASEVADAVWDEALAGHAAAGSTGEALAGAVAPTAAEVADAVWDETFTGHLASDTFGEQLASLSTAAEIDTQLSASHGAGSWEDAGGLTAAAVADAVWDEAMADHDTAGTFGAGLQTLEDAVLIWPTPVGGGTTALTLIQRAMAIADVHDNFVSDTEWLNWLNQEQYALRLFISRAGWTLPFDTTTATITADGWDLSTDGAAATEVERNGAGHYRFTPSLADVMAVVCVHEVVSGTLKRLTFTNDVDFLRQSLNGSSVTGHATTYRMRMYGNEIHADFYPTPQTGEVYLITYLSAPTPLTATNQSVALPMGWEERLVLGMARRALIKEESSTSEIEKLIREMDSQIEQLCWNRQMAEQARVRNTDPNLQMPEWQYWYWL